ncbi:ComF family protein [Candidatus Dojkabacteria bacterium]|uniref:ComF family protein n=1 Tax=Candidatus Dojkabacteria bacterium TaxID=2099670 RepID=A0A955L571_9BACT|nr:ComF family protein [Candidatus Dojkabacteria bacterium]
MFTVLKSIFPELVEFILPRFCLLCDTKGDDICDECVQTKLRFSKEHKCHVCHKKLSGQEYLHSNCSRYSKLDGVFIVVDYNEAAKKILYEIKFEYHYKYADKVALLMKTKFNQLALDIDFVIPVPLHRNKKWLRGFNQAELICRKLPIPIKNIITRVSNTRTQVGLDQQARKSNLIGAFELNTKLDLSGKDLLLVDDVTTSGATLEECAKLLKDSGVSNVYALVWAHELDFL